MQPQLYSKSSLRAHYKAVRKRINRRSLPNDPVATKEEVSVERVVAHGGIPIRAIVLACSHHFRIGPKSILSQRCNHPDVIQARHVAMYMSRKLTSRSFPDIGDRFNRHHTTVMHAVQKISAELTDGNLAADVEAIEAILPRAAKKPTLN